MPGSDVERPHDDDGDPTPDERPDLAERNVARRDGGNDGGVLRRLVRRSGTGAAVLEIIGLVLIAAAFLLPWGLVTGTAALVAVALLAIGAVLAVRATFWSRLANSREPLEGGAVGVVGPVKALSPTRPGAPLRRKLTATVVPIAVRGGPQPGGGALLVHARSDGIALAEGDDIEVWRAARTGPQALPAEGQKPVSGRFILRRDADGVVFYATSRLTDVL